MRTALRIAPQLALILVVGLAGCTSSKKAARTEAMTELQRMYAAAQDMNIVVSAGVTKDEYSKRLTDALLKFGDRVGGCRQAVAKLPQGEEQSTAAEVCQHLSKAMDAFTDAKEYFGPKPDPDDPEILTNELTEEAYARTKEQFPSLQELPIAETDSAGYKFYPRRAMVQALWKVAGEESEAARSRMERLATL